MLQTPHPRVATVRRALSAAVLALLFTTGPLASAQPKRDPAAADEAFRAAVAAKLKGDLATACAKFDASMQLDPSPSALLNIAECLEHEGKLARAWSETQKARVLNQETPGDQRRRELDTYATTTLERLRDKLAWIQITLPSSPPGLTLEKDGVTLPLAVLDQPIPADPGGSKLKATAPGHRPFELDLTLQQGKTAQVTVTLTPSPAAPTASVTATASAAPATRPLWPWIAGGAGIALVGVAVGFGISEAGTQADIDASCHAQPNGKCPVGYPYQEQNDRLYRDFGLSLGFGIAGAVAIGAGAVGLLLRPSTPSPATPRTTIEARRAPGAAFMINPYAGPGSAGFTLGGAF